MYKVAGVSKFKGEFKVRFANDLTRVKLLQKAGNTDINLVDLPKAMNKPAAVTFLKGSDLYKVPAQAAAIDAADAKYNTKATVKVKKEAVSGKKTATKAVTKSVKAKVTAKPSLAAIKARVKAAPKTETPVAAPVAEVAATAVESTVEA